MRGGEQPNGERTRACSACVRMASATRRGVGTFPPTGEYEKGVGKIQTGWLRGTSANARVGGNPRVVNPGRKLATPSAPRGRSKARDPRVINPSGFPEPVAAPEISKSAVRPERTSHDADARPSSIGPPSPLGRVDGARARRAAPRPRERFARAGIGRGVQAGARRAATPARARRGALDGRFRAAAEGASVRVRRRAAASVGDAGSEPLVYERGAVERSRRFANPKKKKWRIACFFVTAHCAFWLRSRDPISFEPATTPARFRSLGAFVLCTKKIV